MAINIIIEGDLYTFNQKASFHSFPHLSRHSIAKKYSFFPESKVQIKIQFATNKFSSSHSQWTIVEYHSSLDHATSHFPWSVILVNTTIHLYSLKQSMVTWYFHCEITLRASSRPLSSLIARKQARDVHLNRNVEHSSLLGRLFNIIW